MAILTDFFNTPSEIAFEGTVWKLRQPTLEEECMFQVYLEQEAYLTIQRRTYESEIDKTEDRKRLTESIACGEYEYGGPLAVQALNMPKGIAAMVRIICREQGMTESIARRMVRYKLAEIAATLVSKLPQIDPKALGEVLNKLGLPADYFSNGSATRRSTDPLESLVG